MARLTACLLALTSWLSLASAQVVEWTVERASSGTPASTWSEDFGATQAPNWIRDAAGNLYGTGVEQTGDSSALMVVKFSPTGSRLWKQRIDTPGNDEGEGLVLDRSGNLLVLGLIHDGDRQAPTLLSFDPDGGERWRFTVTHPGGRVDPKLVQGGADGMVYLLLEVEDAEGNPDGQLLAIEDLGSSAGERWRRTLAVLPEASADYPRSLAVSPNGDLVLAAVNNNLHHRLSVFDPQGELVWSRADTETLQDFVSEAFVADDASAIVVGLRRFDLPPSALGVVRSAYDSQGQPLGTTSHAPAAEASLLSAQAVAQSGDGALHILASYEYFDGGEFFSALQLLQFDPDGTPRAPVEIEAASSAAFQGDIHLALHEDGGTPVLYAAWRHSPLDDSQPAQFRAQRFNASGAAQWAGLATYPAGPSRLKGISADGAGPVLAYTFNEGSSASVQARARALAAADGSLRFDVDPGETSPLAARVLQLQPMPDGSIVQLVEHYAGVRRLELERRDAQGQLIFAVEPPADAPSFDHALGLDAAGRIFLTRVEGQSTDTRYPRISAFESDGELAWDLPAPPGPGIRRMATAFDNDGLVVAVGLEVEGLGLLIANISLASDGSTRWTHVLPAQSDAFLTDVQLLALHGGDSLLAWGTLRFGASSLESTLDWLRLSGPDGQVAWRQGLVYDEDSGYLAKAAVGSPSRAYLLSEYRDGASNLEGQRLLAIDLADGNPLWATPDGLDALWSYPITMLADAGGVTVLANGEPQGNPDAVDAFVARYSALTGERQWLSVIDAGVDDQGSDLARDADGRWYVAGSQRGADRVERPWLQALAPDGAQLWQSQLPGDRGRVTRLAYDAAGNGLYAGGRSGPEGVPFGSFLARVLLDELPERVFASGFEND